jgi:glucose-6-phosphate isomerase
LKRENCIDLSTIEITESYNILQGTRSALYANDRESISVTVQEVTPRTVGALVALYERAVGIYASLVNINAYHQPGMLLKTVM